MSNITDRQKLDTAILTLHGMDGRRDAQLKKGISKTWLSNQRIIQEAIVRDYRAKVEAEQLQ